MIIITKNVTRVLDFLCIIHDAKRATIFKMASGLLSRTVRPVLTAFLRPYLTSSSAYSAAKGAVVVDKTDTSVETTRDEQQVRIFWVLINTINLV